MKILLVDAGNTRLKWASTDEKSNASTSLPNEAILETMPNNAILYGKNTPIDCYADLIEAEGNKHKQVVLVSVQGNNFTEQAEEITSKARLDFFNVVSQRQLGEFKNAYKIPKQLGADRFVAMLVAHEIATTNKPKSCIVIDCGTAVTIDAIDASGQHLGGLILPGLQVCSNSLVKDTQQLFIAQVIAQAQDSNQQQTFDLLTDNTSDAIISGSFYGLSSAIKETCLKIEKQIQQSQQRQQFQLPQEIIKIVCGGDAKLLQPELSDDFLIQSDLVMQGLKWIMINHFQKTMK